MTVNGEKLDLAIISGMDLMALIAHFGLAPERVAIELNGDLIQRVAYDKTKLSESDIVEIIHYVGGG